MDTGPITDAGLEDETLYHRAQLPRPFPGY